MSKGSMMEYRSMTWGPIFTWKTHIQIAQNLWNSLTPIRCLISCSVILLMKGIWRCRRTGGILAQSSHTIRQRPSCSVELGDPTTHGKHKHTTRFFPETCKEQSPVSSSTLHIETGVLRLHVQHQAPEHVPSVDHRDWSPHHPGDDATHISNSQVPEFPSGYVFWDGSFRSGPLRPQVIPAYWRARCHQDSHTGSVHGVSVWGGSPGVCNPNPWEMETWKVWHCRKQPPDLSCACGGWCLCPLPSMPHLPQMERCKRLWSSILALALVLIDLGSADVLHHLHRHSSSLPSLKCSVLLLLQLCAQFGCSFLDIVQYLLWEVDEVGLFLQVCSIDGKTYSSK